MTIDEIRAALGGDETEAIERAVLAAIRAAGGNPSGGPGAVALGELLTALLASAIVASHETDEAQSAAARNARLLEEIVRAASRRGEPDARALH